jgi:uncharacterized protein (DUF2252 family)
MIEQLIEGYEAAFDEPAVENESLPAPASIKTILRKATKRTWKQLARERIEDVTPRIPLGKCFWPLSKEEQKEIETLFEIREVSHLATSLSSRNENAPARVLDAAYWVKGCSSLGKLRYAVLLDVGNNGPQGKELCLLDIKEASSPAAPRQTGAPMPTGYGERVVEGARHLSPYLGERMIATRLLDRSVFLRELLPQDMKIEVKQLSQPEAQAIARYLALVLGKAHVRQMDASTKKAWRKSIQQKRSKTLDAPSWLWSGIVDLIASHESNYLEHCRKYALRFTTATLTKKQ